MIKMIHHFNSIVTIVTLAKYYYTHIGHSTSEIINEKLITYAAMPKWKLYPFYYLIFEKLKEKSVKLINNK